MESFTTPLTADVDVYEWEADLTAASKIAGKIDHLHIAASLDVARELRSKWWVKIISEVQRDIKPGEVGDSSLYVAGFEPDKLDLQQVKKLGIFKLLGTYVWPMLDEHNVDMTYPLKRAAHWKKRYHEELESLLKDGLAYDWNNDGVAEYLTESRRVSIRTINLTRG